MYLWGFVFRLGQDIDAVFLLQGALLMFVLFGSFNGRENYFRNLYYSIKVVFVIYYFFAGLNKFIDLDYIEFFQFDLVYINQQFYNMFKNEGLMYVPRLPDFGSLNILTNYLGAALTYIVHIAAPALLFFGSKSKILFFWIFYSIFHYLTAFVGIFFHMNFFAFLLLLPVDTIFSKKKDQNGIKVIYDSDLSVL